jgi:hypothetical protein
MTAFIPNKADVIVTFKTGEVKTYRISAGPGVGGHLARKAGSCGVLSLFNHECGWGIPLTSIHAWEIKPVPVPEGTYTEQVDESEATNG